jgi:hypothetical protein
VSVRNGKAGEPSRLSRLAVSGLLTWAWRMATGLLAKAHHAPPLSKAKKLVTIATRFRFKRGRVAGGFRESGHAPRDQSRAATYG